ncbi:hypothetical protein WR25_03160 [Diploscapter pachys]|uniref:Nuclear nucleic acid-binding protein C1D n=1 Tax=Diploscapter pachys TaxID=2018661 RepID=A0A2A2KT65_9BILA|nr:hypothetical protein WR25_03160 [Diploscapter pachys]
MTSLPEDVNKALGHLKRFNDALTTLEDALEPYFNEDDDKSKQDEKLALDEGREKLMSLFVLDSLIWSLANLREAKPQENADLGAEMKRTKKLVNQFKKQELRRASFAPRVNTSVAKSFLRNALFELDNKNRPSTSNAETQEEGVDTEIKDEDVKMEIASSEKPTPKIKQKKKMPQHTKFDSDNDDVIVEAEVPARKKLRKSGPEISQTKSEIDSKQPKKDDSRAKAGDFF